MIKEILLKKVLESLFNAGKDKAKKLLKAKNADFHTTQEAIQQSLQSHLQYINNWSGEISFRGIKSPKATTDVFIELDMFVSPKKYRIQLEEQVETIPLKKIFDNDNHHIVLLGQPGAGKTTSMKYVCYLLLFDPEFQSDLFNFPILVRFRDLNATEISPHSSLIIDTIYNILGLNVEFPQNSQGQDVLSKSEKKSIKDKLVCAFLEEFKVLLVLEGFDELANHNYRDRAITEIMQLANKLVKCRMIVTARTGEFSYKIENTNEYELCSLSKEQIHNFASKWLNDSKQAARFLQKLYKTPFADTAIKPLTLAHLCAIYERIKDIPEKPKTIYKRIINLLLEEWDQQQSIKRESRYARFEPDRKYDFLCHLAYVLTEGLNTTVFSTRDLLFVYKSIHEEYGLKSGEAKLVVSEIEAHTGLFIQSGYEIYEFAHKSLQEFLAAEYLVKLPKIPNDWNTLSYLPNELAIAVASSSSPSSYFDELVLGRIKPYRFKLSGDFIRTFSGRLLIEKPDFKPGLRMTLSLLILYTYFIETIVLMTNMREFEADPIFKGLEEEIKYYYSKTFMKDIIKYNYITERIYETSDNDHVHRLSLSNREIKEIMRNQIKPKDLPECLFIRSSVLQIE